MNKNKISFEELIKQIKNLKNLPNVDIGTIGKSLLGNPLYYVHIGDYSKNQIIVECSIHAREYITSLLSIAQIKYLYNKKFDGGIYFLPLLNPDGVRLVLEGADFIESRHLKKYLIDINNNSTDFSLWKANANAVDLNVNFDAEWAKGKQNVFYVSPANFVGYFPNSEIENLSLIKFLNKISPIGSLSYHSKGEVIYYGFEALTPSHIKRDKTIAIALSKITGYEIIKTENSTGGFSDYVSEKFGIPSLTIEVGNDLLSHPITKQFLPQIFKKNKDVPLSFFYEIINYKD